MLRSQLVDQHFCGVKELSALYLLIAKNGEAALIDSGTPRNFERIQKTISDFGVKKEQLTTILLTHAHLDHSGNIYNFTKNYPNIKVYLNPMTARIMADPEDIGKRMKESMKKGAYDKEFMDLVRPVDEKFFVETKENMMIKLGGEKCIKVINTPGHSRDHISFFDVNSKTLYTGDAFGTCYNDITPQKSLFSCPPLFVPSVIPSTIQKVKDLNPKRFALAHFGYIQEENVLKHIEQCQNFMERFFEIMNESQKLFDKGDKPKARERLSQYYDEVFYPQCTTKSHRLRGHMEVNYQGMLSVLDPKSFRNYYK